MAGAVIPPPDSRALLPPLLACLSVAGASKRPPAALLQLLSPILRQRIQLLASDDWLPLLSWDSAVGTRLPIVAENIHVEPHPASGEIEVEEPDQILYRRSDPETLHARLVLQEYGIIPTYLWCTGGDKGDRWELAELRGIQDADDGTEWFAGVAEATEAGFRRRCPGASNVEDHEAPTVECPPAPVQAKEEDDDDASYWAAYDQTPAQTPHQKRSPAPPTTSNSIGHNKVQVGPTQTELEYFARYASEVQPAMDPHDPDEAAPAPGESTINGDALNLHSIQQDEPTAPPFDSKNDFGSHLPSRKDDAPEHIESLHDSAHTDVPLDHPRPSSSASASSTSIERLEREADNYGQAELGVKQHISTDIKSLFRLARTAGIEREEFERIIMRELAVLPLLEREMS